MSNYNKNPIALTRKRTEKGLTRNQLAELTGISSRAIECYEQRRTDFKDAPLRKALLIAAALDCTVEELVDND